MRGCTADTAGGVSRTPQCTDDRTRDLQKAPNHVATSKLDQRERRRPHDLMRLAVPEDHGTTHRSSSRKLLPCALPCLPSRPKHSRTSDTTACTAGWPGWGRRRRQRRRRRCPPVPTQQNWRLRHCCPLMCSTPLCVSGQVRLENTPRQRRRRRRRLLLLLLLLLRRRRRRHRRHRRCLRSSSRVVGCASAVATLF
jgi:hypothetical protein